MEVVWQPKATKQLLRIGDRKLRTRIVNGVAELANFPDCRNVKALAGHQYGYRLRIGNWRVFFEIIDGTPAIISIEEVKKRDERTY